VSGIPRTLRIASPGGIDGEVRRLRRTYAMDGPRTAGGGEWRPGRDSNSQPAD
jgi:hypothetical protein